MKWMKIKSITTSQVSTTVYDLSIDTHHNFVASGVVVHNCYASNVPEWRSPGRNEEVPGYYYFPEQQWSKDHQSLFTAFLDTYHRAMPGHFLRIFALSDYKPNDRNFWIDVLSMCKSHSVKTVVFTKSRECVEVLAPLAARLIISLDNSKRWKFNSPEWVGNRRIVNGYKRKFSNVVTAAMVVDERDIKEVKADFYIAFHGQRKHIGLPKPIQQNDVLEIVGRYKGCTPAHRCFGCPTRCTLNDKAKSPALVPLTIGGGL